jgi:hypothetical protein
MEITYKLILNYPSKAFDVGKLYMKSHVSLLWLQNLEDGIFQVSTNWLLAVLKVRKVVYKPGLAMPCFQFVGMLYTPRQGQRCHWPF